MRKEHTYLFNTDAGHCVAVITYNCTRSDINRKMDSHIWRYSASYKNKIEILIKATDIRLSKYCQLGDIILDQGNQ